MHTIVTRADAAASGLKFFYTGKPCGQGHDARRYTSTGNCVECHKARSLANASNGRQGRVARLRGHFSYALHPDDHAAALAYCQALDLQRGLMPTQPQANAPRTPMTLAEVAAARERIFGVALAAVCPPEVDPLAHGRR